MISVDEYGPAIGIRFLSAVLKRAGYETLVIFVTGHIPHAEAMGEAPLFPRQVHDGIAALAAGSLYVGLSVATPTYHKAREVTRELKSRLAVPIVWGGIHAIVLPAECLQHADMVCTGEGEDFVVTLADRLRDKRPYHDIPGLRIPGQSSEIRMPLVDVSGLPEPDYAFDGTHFVATATGLLRAARDNYTKTLGKRYFRANHFYEKDYFLAITRGCSYKCSYCINGKYNALHKDHKVGLFRSRNIADVIRELIRAKDRLTFARVTINDDCFTTLSKNAIRHFCSEYKRHIGLPFVIIGAVGSSLTEEKLEYLCDAGLIELRIGIQTGSERIRRLFDRTWEDNHKISQMARLLNKFIKQKKLRTVMYYLIVDIPWETAQDRIATFDLVMSLPRPFLLLTNALTFYPGILLSERALSEELLPIHSDNRGDWLTYTRGYKTPINDIYELMGYLPLPSTLLRLLARDTLVTNKIRQILLALFWKIPELSLVPGTWRRYDLELYFMVKDKEELFYRPTRNRGPARKRPVRSRLLFEVRRFLLNAYIHYSYMKRSGVFGRQ